MKEKEREEKETKELKEYRSTIDNLHDNINKINFTAQNYDVNYKMKIENILGKYSNTVSDYEKKSLYFMHIPMNCDNAVLEKPEWLDIDKFKKGQQFARDHLAGLFLGQLYGLLCLLCHQSGLETMIMTQKSHTPYLAFKRYLSTAECVRNWYKEDPWCKDTQAHKDILKVRKIHLAVNAKFGETNKKEIEVMDIIKNPYCPVFHSVINDYSTKLPKNLFSDYWYEKFYQPLTMNPKEKNINQRNMSYTLFGFMGFPLLFPRYFGIDENKNENLENLCYVWRSIGYLLGVDDRVNICSGSLEDIKGRCQVYIDELVKPAFRRLSPQWEHMIRCIIEGHGYYIRIPSFETTILQLAELLDFQMPAVYSSLTYFQRIEYYINKYVLRYTMKFKFMRNLFNRILNRAMDKALHFDQAKLAELKTRSMISPLHVSFDN